MEVITIESGSTAAQHPCSNGTARCTTASADE
jgi:hypothetical protein